MELKIKNFWDAVFEQLIGHTRDESGRLYSHIYRCECLDILKEVKEQLQNNINKHGGYGSKNVYSAFLTAFKHKLPECKIKEYSLSNEVEFEIIVNRFDELFGKDFDLRYAWDDMMYLQGE